MAVELNHTIVAARDPAASARFVSEVLGLAAPNTSSEGWSAQTAWLISKR